MIKKEKIVKIKSALVAVMQDHILDFDDEQLVHDACHVCDKILTNGFGDIGDIPKEALVKANLVSHGIRLKGSSDNSLIRIGEVLERIGRDKK